MQHILMLNACMLCTCDGFVLCFLLWKVSKMHLYIGYNDLGIFRIFRFIYFCFPRAKIYFLEDATYMSSKYFIRICCILIYTYNFYRNF
jgi:hypothetical protein